MTSADTCKFEQAVPVPRAGCGQVQSGGCRRLRQQALPLRARCGALHERARQGQGRRVILQGLHGGLQCLHHPRSRFLRGPQGAAPPTTPNPKPQTPNFFTSQPLVQTRLAPSRAPVDVRKDVRPRTRTLQQRRGSPGSKTLNHKQHSSEPQNKKHKPATTKPQTPNNQALTPRRCNRRQAAAVRRVRLAPARGKERWHKAIVAGIIVVIIIVITGDLISTHMIDGGTGGFGG